MSAGEVFTDSAGVSARYTPLRDVQPGDTIVSGWRPYLVVERVEDDGDRVRMHFKSGHVGGWDDLSAAVPVARVPAVAQGDTDG